MNKSTNKKIIYIAGFPRSGTTWFANLLNASPNIIYRHEILGRKYKSFGDKLFQAIKFNFGLTENEYEKAMNTICFADIETDRPPFFKKNQILQSNTKFHYYLWAIAKFIPFLRNVYGNIFKIRSSKKDIRILLKETGASSNLESIIKGLKVQKTLVLVRSPYGAITSHIKGINTKKMPPLSVESKTKWFEDNKNSHYITSLCLTNQQISDLSVPEFFAINWRVYYENIIINISPMEGCYTYFYEDFVDNTTEEVNQLFTDIDLPFDESVQEFIQDSSGSTSDKKQLKDSKSDFYSVFKAADFDKESWKRILTDDDLKIIDAHTKEFYTSLINNKKGI